MLIDSNDSYETKLGLLKNKIHLILRANGIIGEKWAKELRDTNTNKIKLGDRNPQKNRYE